MGLEIKNSCRPKLGGFRISGVRLHPSKKSLTGLWKLKLNKVVMEAYAIHEMIG